MAGASESFKSGPQATKDYFDELQHEMKRVTWPSPEAGASHHRAW